MFEETTCVPIIIVAPNQVALKTEVKARPHDRHRA